MVELVPVDHDPFERNPLIRATPQGMARQISPNAFDLGEHMKPEAGRPLPSLQNIGEGVVNTLLGPVASGLQLTKSFLDGKGWTMDTDSGESHTSNQSIQDSLAASGALSAGALLSGPKGVKKVGWTGKVPAPEEVPHSTHDFYHIDADGYPWKISDSNVPGHIADIAMHITGNDKEKAHALVVEGTKGLALSPREQNLIASVKNKIDNGASGESVLGHNPSDFKLPVHADLVHEKPDPLFQSWLVDGKHQDLNNPEHNAAIYLAAHGGDLEKAYSYAKSLDETDVMDVLTGGKKIPQDAFPLSEKGVKLIDSLPDGKLYQDVGPKILTQMAKEGLSSPHYAAEMLTKSPELPIEDAFHYANAANSLFDKLQELKSADAPAGKKVPALQSVDNLTPKAPPKGWESVDSSAWPKPGAYRWDKVPLEEAIKPLDWKSFLPDDARGPMGHPDTLQRAAEQGYNIDLPLFKGMEKDLVDRYNPDLKINSLWDPSTKPKERAVFAADRPTVANSYTGSDGHVLPLYARSDNAFEVHWPSVAGHNTYEGPTMQRIIDHARDRGADMLVIKNINDLGGMQTQYAIMDPSKLRSPYAKFDPSAKGQNDLLAARGLTLVPVDHDPFGGKDEQ